MTWSSQIFILSFLGLITVASATFFIKPSPTNSNASNICIYSADPTKYSPKCFVCLNAVYPNALQACTNMTSMPSNISYSQASCIEKNCAINFPQPPAAPQKPDLASKIGPILGLFKHISDKMHKRSIAEDDNPSDSNRIDLVPYAGEGSNKMLLQLDTMRDIQITRQIETHASGQITAVDEDDDDDDGRVDDYY